MEIHHKQEAQQGEFFVLDEHNAKIAKLTYFFVDTQTINANHTYVSEVLREQGVADKLYQALIHFIRENQLTLIPSGSYRDKKCR